MERGQWIAAVREEGRKSFGFSSQRFIDGDMNEFVRDMDELLEMPRGVAVELRTRAGKGFIGINDILMDVHAAAMALTMTVYRCNKKHYEDNDVWYDALVEWNALPKKKYFAAMSSDLQKRINDWNKFNVDSK
jgi:hypothetical protein